MDVILTRLTLHCLRPLQYSAGLVSTTQRQGVVEIFSFIFTQHESRIFLTDVRRRLQVDGKAKSSSGLLELPRSGHRQRHGRFGQGRGPRGAKCEIVQVAPKNF